MNQLVNWFSKSTTDRLWYILGNGMRRRKFITLIGSAAAGIPAGAYAQRLAIPVVGVLSPEGPKTGNVNGLLEGLRELGYVEGRNIRFEYRWAEGKFDRLPELAADLVRLQVDVIVAFATQAAEVSKKQTATIPIVMVAVSDPVGAGLASSLAHPGSNVTGTSSLAAALVSKQLELLKLVAPSNNSAATIFNPTNMTSQALQIKEATTASQTLGLQLRFIEVQATVEFERAFATIVQEQIGVLLILADALYLANFKALAELSIKSRLITMAGYRTFADAGGLMSYGSNYLYSYKAAARYVDKILKGRKAGDLPIDQSSKFEFVVNLQTAKLLGVEIPTSVLGFATEVIE
jgi:putative tryptophan/tyrosine transport system substrate-binding protein